jgi:hypothetical protein
MSAMNLLRPSLFVFVFASLLLPTACGSTVTPATFEGDASADDGAANADGSAASADAACDASATAQCALEWKCSAFDAQSRWPDQATCVARTKAQCLASLAAPSTGATPASVQACASARAGEACADFFASNPPAACHAQSGALADGQACAFNAQCKSAFCRTAKGAACGTCGAAAKLGESCATFGCDYGLTCESTLQKCVIPAASGAPCDATTPCAAGLSCVGATGTKVGACQPAGATVGAACDEKDLTAPRCAQIDGLRCATKTKLCVGIALVPANAPCGALGDGSFASCAAGGVCKLAAGTAQGTCVAAAADGQACDATGSNGPGCAAPARCVGTTTTTCAVASAAACPVGG